MWFSNEELLGLILIMLLEIDMQYVDRNFGGRRVQIVGGYQRLDELVRNIKSFFLQSIKRRLPRFTSKNLYRKTSRT